MVNYTDFFTGNKVLNCAIMAWIGAQILKGILVFISEGKMDFRRFFESGGMPSSHSACMVAMTTAIGRIIGIYSVEFALAFTMSGIVMYDATGVRRAAGEQAKVLNHIMDNWGKATPEFFQKDLKELLGHTPIQVLAGALMGLIVGYTFIYL